MLRVLVRDRSMSTQSFFAFPLSVRESGWERECLGEFIFQEKTTSNILVTP